MSFCLSDTFHCTTVLAGTFDGWTNRIPLNKSEKDFTLILNLPPGPYQYKFIVDGKWRYAPDLPTSADRDGNVNNILEVKEVQRTQDQKLGGTLLFLVSSFSLRLYLCRERLVYISVSRFRVPYSHTPTHQLRRPATTRRT